MKILPTILSLLLFAATLSAFSQDDIKNQSALSDAGQRANEIVAQVGIKDVGKRTEVTNLLKQHFDTLYAIFAERKQAMEIAGKVDNKELADSRSRSAWDAANSKFNKLNAVFLGKLSKELNAEQLEKVKDSMTEGGLAKEYNNYLAMFPNLKDQHKAQIRMYLTEARENAMNAETAEGRKEWFIKYRGRANNFLAAAGYDLRKATDELNERKARVKVQ